MSKFKPLDENAHFSAMGARYEVYRAHSESQEGRTHATLQNLLVVCRVLS